MRILVTGFFLLLAVCASPALSQEVPSASQSFDQQFEDIADPAALPSLEASPVEIPSIPGAPRHQSNGPVPSERPATPRTAHPHAERILPATAESADKPIASSNVVRIVLILSLMAFLPAMVISMTSFVRIAVVLSMIRHAFGMPETPPNQVLVSLALFLTAFSMMPTVEAVNSQALQPFMAGKLNVEQAMDQASAPLRSFMLRQVRDQDIKAIYDMSRKPLPARAEDVDLMRLVPAFMLNELRVAFRIGFVILLPFLLIDLVVSSVLLALGMMMVPPSTLSLPLKVLMFVLIDGWSLVLQGVVGSIH
ncbi:MAG TPA: flagellar type III secretion system pore protein FliP [Novosphingobium sp.]